ncbi:hypothetical protein [Paracoccus sp. TOH]|uniref:hypothetical protein n=1 Tax=Paracoccus sp. TOH TaxID=1263728 RepID=UPI0025AF00BE|nr:hypothetical protein [Paracoccus sp. TOH]WJS84229.1 hypothetical protein NBE95_00100 [Paracoccus sp. TOH]
MRPTAARQRARAREADGAGGRTPAPPPRRYRLTERQSGAVLEVDAEALERILGIEAGYVDWGIAEDGAFENRRWRVR